MHGCAIARARATIGGPSFELRTPSRNASFHRGTRLPPAWTPRALDARLGSASDAAPAPAATRNCRRESDCSRADGRELLRPREIEPSDEEVKTSRLSSRDVIRPLSCGTGMNWPSLRLCVCSRWPALLAWGRCRGVACCRHLGTWGPDVLLGQHLDEVVARDVFVEVDPAGVDLDAFARPRWSLSAGVVDLAVDLEQAVVLGACRGGRVDEEGHPAAAEVRR